jgi:hypothetical protein
MTERIVIHCDSAEELPAARAALEKHGGCQDVRHEGGATLSVLVHDSRDAEEEITELLNEAGVTCYVEKG